MKVSKLVDYAIWAALAGVFVLVLMRRSSGPDTGHAAAPIDLPLLLKDGRFRLDQQRGKPVLVEMFASWCGACRRAAPAFADAYQDHGKRVRFVGIMIDEDAETARRAAQSWEIPYDVALDDAGVARAYKVELLPTVVLIDGQGVVRRVWTGAPSRSQLENWLTEL
ncbi:MAG TPA: TlpA disulfide reductase family protein [Polyangiaceae bacterium]|nr:TlpA disulfide reductase family protein [Polyangiaceae bacterium]